MAAKIRVYELARDLNMKSKALLDKLGEMGISVGSHVSSLDDETVARIRENLFRNKPDSLEVTCVKPTVIRRRKKAVSETTAPAAEDAPPPSAESSDEKPEEPSAGELSPSVPKTAEQDQPPVAEKPERPPQAHAPVPDKEKKPPAETDAPPPVSDPDQREKADAEKVPKKSEKKTERETDLISAVKEKRMPAEEPTETNAPDKTAKRMKNRKKKKKRDTPAKIIKLPTPEERAARKSEADAATSRTSAKGGPAPSSDRHPRTKGRPDATKNRNGDQKKADLPRPGSDPAGVQMERTGGKDKKKKGWKKQAHADVLARPASGDKKSKDIKWSKKKISFKRKEVVEGAALYAGGQRGRRPRKGAKVKAVKAQKPTITTPKAIKRRIKIDEAIVLSDLAKRMGIKANEMIKKLMMLGVMATVNQTIDFDTAVLVASEFNYEVEKASFEEDLILNERLKEDDPGKLSERSPVVTIMGHVDHGKTSLLDIIRKTRITEIEAGGITQHIGAHSVSTKSGQITFLDTPGHEAFTAMRGRGAKVTDLVVLVVAADDGVMPQTIEAINHSKAAGVPIIVAVNKIDKLDADPERVVRQLSEHGLMPEDWGGDTIFVKVSAKQNQGIDELLEMILLQSEVLELKANPDKLAIGYVIESKLDAGRGPVATVLIQDGTLHSGDSVVCGIHHGKIRAMLNDRGTQTDAAGPCVPVEVLGLSGVPNAGDEFVALSDDKSAKQVSLHRSQKQRSKDLAKTSRLSLEKLFEKMQQGEVKDLNLILKTDVHGSIEALKDSLTKLSNDEVNINVIHSATGTVTEADVSLAAVSEAIIIGFNVRPSAKVQTIANEESVDMRFYNIIYHVIKEIQDAILGMMDSTYEERVLGRAEIREVFHVPKIGAIAGCYVTDGKIQRGALARLVREGIVCYDGKLSSLRRFKDDVKEVQTGFECGIGVENYNDIKVGDIVECYYLEEIKPEL
ncbi:MAG: translation initiation factor IF-2 [Desulfobacteraceae bacterium 4572_88]|nr:MAG: translation initiation factor IF-2 [Desulfobacteraceae bacterium 4572_88]